MGLMTAKQVARALGISLGTLYRMVRTGKLPAIRIGTGRGLRLGEPLLTIHQLAVDSGIKDLAEHHDHYLTEADVDGDRQHPPNQVPMVVGICSHSNAMRTPAS